SARDVATGHGVGGGHLETRSVGKGRRLTIGRDDLDDQLAGAVVRDVDVDEDVLDVELRGRDHDGGARGSLVVAGDLDGRIRRREGVRSQAFGRQVVRG